MMKIINVIRLTTDRLTHLAVLGALYTGSAWADLPAIEQPSSGGGGGVINTFKGYIKDGFALGGLLLAAAGFIVVALAALSSFHDVREGKAKWAHFVTFVLVGAILLVVIIWLANKALDIF
ncbi:TIGR03745 family integrating conjugative element membrane protein [Acerihabitans arboris]|nr:TIGR03745 family integrating conjugative element membrane protein [Acerihabitans arboris]